MLRGKIGNAANDALSFSRDDIHTSTLFSASIIENVFMVLLLYGYFIYS